jgi:hypothetical protein
MSTLQSIKDAVALFESENAKFSAGNASAGTRARNALSDIAKLAKVRRAEITAEKTARKEAN